MKTGRKFRLFIASQRPVSDILTILPYNAVLNMRRISKMQYSLLRKAFVLAVAASLLGGCASVSSTQPSASASAEAVQEASRGIPDDDQAAEAFAADYIGVSEDNLFVYRTSDEILKILQGGSGVVYFGAPWCPWCQKYVIHLNDVAKANDIEKIFYYNITNDRKNNTEFYQKVVSILGDTLDKDSEGNPRVFIPETVVVLKGKVIGTDNTTSMCSEDTDGKPADWWTDERVQTYTNKMAPLFKQAANYACSSCNLDEASASPASK
jgi:thiol-disulfide isomerase/thioredoxin